MPIKEDSFRIGSGRYLQGRGYLEKIGKEVLRYGKQPLVVGGKTALEKTGAVLERALSEACNNYEIIVHKGTCNEESARAISRIAEEKGYDVIVGVGGGVIMDLAKLCGHFAKLPVLNVPTISATCAAYTPLSVRYTPEGRTVGSIHYEREVDCVIADTEIIAAQPVRLFLAGVFDALAKFVEIKQRYKEDAAEYPLGLDYAYILSKRSFQLLNSTMEKCICDMRRGVISAEVENAIFTTIAATGVISGIARGSNQTAVAHKFYEATKFLFPENTAQYTHGEIVGVGLLLQNHFNHEPENNEILLKLMQQHNMPCCIQDLDIPKTHEVFEKYYEKICGSSAIESREECQQLEVSLRYLWELSPKMI